MAPTWNGADLIAELIAASELTPGAVVRTEIKNFGGQVVMLLHVSEVERTETGDVEVTCDEGELLYHWDLANPDHRPIDSGELDEVRIDLVHRFGADEMVELVDVAR